MTLPQKPRKEPTVSFSVRCPVSLEADAVAFGQQLGLERNGFIVAAIQEKIARERRRAQKRVA